MKRCLACASLVVILLASVECLEAGEGFSGTLQFKNGQSVHFDHIGTKQEVITYLVTRANRTAEP